MTGVSAVLDEAGKTVKLVESAREKLQVTAIAPK